MTSGATDPNQWWSTHGPESILAHRIRVLRRARTWSQSDLAAKMQEHGFAYHQNTVSRIESGTQSVTLNEAAALTMIFSVAADELLMPEGNEEEIQRLAARIEAASDALSLAEGDLATAQRTARDAREHMEMADRVCTELAHRRASLAADLETLRRQMAAIDARPAMPPAQKGES